MANKSVNTRELSIFCSQMSMVIQAGIGFMEGVPLLREQTSSKALKAELGKIEDLVKTGVPFAKACQEMPDSVFPPYMKNMITIGDASGSMDVIFDRLADYYEQDNKLRRKVRGAVTYPAVLTLLMIAMVGLLVVKILPMFGDILASMGGSVPPFTQALLNFSAFMNDFGIWILICLIFIILGITFWIKTEAGRRWVHAWQLSFPIARNIFPKIITARFSRSLAILLRSGVSLLNALEMVEELVENTKVEHRFKIAREAIGDGVDLILALDKMQIFPPLFLRLVDIGQKTGFLDDMLSKAAEIFDDEVDESLQRMTNLLEPVIIIILSVVVGIILLSVMLPMISIMNSIG